MPKKHKLQRDIVTSVVNKGKTNYVKVSRVTTSKRELENAADSTIQKEISCSADTFGSLLQAYYHHQKILSYNVVKKK
jgi:hypothetical protein